MSRQSLTLSLLPGSLLVFTSIAIKAESQPVYVRMLESTVFVECDIEFQGEPLMAGSGCGFLVANSEYVITNNHVIDQ
jgi:S1-C subfamily serine protease